MGNQFRLEICKFVEHFISDRYLLPAITPSTSSVCIKIDGKNYSIGPMHCVSERL